MGLGPAEISFTTLEAAKIPEAVHPRWVVLGRSNVGKSSFLNAVVHPQKLFLTGKRPGKTIGLIGAQIRLGKGPESTLEIVDVPGFGFSAGDKGRFGSDWEELLEVLKERSRAKGLLWLWLADPIRKPAEEEELLRSWLGAELQALVFTKVDRIKNDERRTALKNWSKILGQMTEGPYWVSALKGSGIEEVFKSARNFVKECSV